MYKLFAFFLVVFLSNESMAFTHRIRRQSGTENANAAQAQLPVQPNGANAQNALSQAEIQECIRNCPVTSEYNPVCGSNRVTYSNPGRLICAQACGVNIVLLRSSPCPPN